MQKIINLTVKDDVTAAVEYLWETGADEVFFAVPRGGAILKNSVGLKLLKREAERLGKKVVFVGADEVGREMAKRAGFLARASLPKVSLSEDDDLADDVLKEVPSQKFESFLTEQVKIRRNSDTAAPAVKTMSDIRPKREIMTTPAEEEPERQELELELEAEPVIEQAGEVEELVIKQFSAAGSVAIDDFLSSPPKEGISSMADIASKPRELDARDEERFKNLFARKERAPLTEEPRNYFSSKLEKIKTSFRKKEVEAEPLVEDIEEEEEPGKSFFSGKFFVIFSSLALILAGAVLYFILPKAEIELMPQAQDASQSLRLTADKSTSKIDVAQNKIPAQLVRLDKKESKEFTATGERQVNEKAKGVLTVYNAYSSAAQGLVEKTRFISSDGKVFRTTRSVIVPGATIVEGKIQPSSIEVEVEADQSGSDYNIGPGRFTIPGFQGTPKYTGFYGESKEAMSGGASGLRKVVSQEDFDRAKEELWQSLEPELDIKGQVPSGFKMLDGSSKTELALAESSVAVGSPSESFILTIKGTAMVLIFNEEDIYRLVEERLEGQLGQDKQLSAKAKNIAYQDVEPDFARGQLKFRADITEKIVWRVDIEGLKKEIVGKNEAQVKEIFGQHTEIAEVKIYLWPFWVKAVPNNLDKIEVIVAEK